MQIVMLAFFIFVSASAMDVYLPAIPIIRDLFSVGQESVQLTLSIFIFILGIGQLIIGPISDQIGRKKILVGSALCFLIGTAICALSTSIHMLIFARGIEAVGSCGITVVTFAIARDLFEGPKLSRAYSLINCGVGISPLIAPVIGSYLTEWFGWRSNFIFIGFLGTILLLLSIFSVKETLSTTTKKMDLKKFYKGYFPILRHPTFLFYAIFAVSAMSLFFSFFSASPVVIVRDLQKPVQNFGFYFLMVGLSFIIGSYISSKITKKYNNRNIALFGASCGLAAGILMLTSYLIWGTTITGFILPNMLAAFGCAFMMAAGAGGAMEPFKENAGTAAALLGVLEFFIAAIVGSLLMRASSDLTFYLSLTMMGVSSCALVVGGWGLSSTTKNKPT